VESAQWMSWKLDNFNFVFKICLAIRANVGLVVGLELVNSGWFFVYLLVAKFFVFDRICDIEDQSVLIAAWKVIFRCPCAESKFEYDSDGCQEKNLSELEPHNQ